jgi:hypothetical protein
MDSMLSMNNHFTDLRNYGYQIRNTRLRMIVFNEKKYPVLLYKIKEICEICFIKTNNFLYEQICLYNSLTDDDKLLLDTIGSLLY